jgi:hypothetical protein
MRVGGGSNIAQEWINQSALGMLTLYEQDQILEK